MSQATWRKEYYPVPADKCPKNKALDHAILKYMGTLPGALKKHKVQLEYGTIRDCADGTNIVFDSDTCALCEYYSPTMSSNCTDCPLHKALGRDCFGINSVYEKFVNNDDPLPMLVWLFIAREQERMRKRKKTTTK